MNYEKLISDVNLAFAGNQFEVSLKKAQEAINKDDSKAEGYVCAGKAALSLGSAEMAEHYFKTATEKDKNNGNIFFLLGYAQAMSGHSSKTVQSLTRALESNCDTSVKGQIYKMISMINTEQGDYGNALTNLSQAEDYIGLDYEILQQRAVCLLLNGAGDVGFAFLNGLAEVVGRIGFAAILVNIPGVGMWAVWTTTCLTWVLTAVMCLIRYKGGKWRKKCLVDIESAETEVIHAEQ